MNITTYLIVMSVAILIVLAIYAGPVLQWQRKRRLQKQLNSDLYGEPVRVGRMKLQKGLPIWQLELATGQITRCNRIKVVKKEGKITKQGIMMQNGFHYLQALNIKNAESKFKKQLLNKYK